MEFLRRHVPLLDALKRADRSSLRNDLAAGLTTAVMLVPQAMGYAMLAGLPPIVGLYASVVPLAVYALLGTSRQLAVGPVAMVSLLVAAGVGSVAQPGTEAFIAYAVLLALMVGAIQLVMGVTRLGFVVNFLSHPVVSGFTSAAALIIGFSQLGHLLGVKLPRSHHVHTIVLAAVEQARAIEPLTALLGVAAIAALVLLKRFKPRWPRALMVVAASVLVVWGMSLHQQGVAIVGDVPAGLPALSLPRFDLAAMEHMLPIAVAISFVGFMESISVAKAFARLEGYDVDANRELIGLGAANLGGALFGAYPVTGGFSRTAVNAQAGAKSGLASLVTAAIVALTLLFLTPLFHYLPKVTLAAIIVTAVAGLVDVAEVKKLWKVDRTDLAMLGLTFAATLALGIEEGILVGVGASLITLVLRTTRPHVAVLGRLPGTNTYRNVARYPEAVRTAGILALRMDAQLYFGNAAFLRRTLAQLESETSERLCAVVLDASGINRLDSSGANALLRVAREYRERDVNLLVAGAKGPVRDVLAKSGLADELGPDAFIPDVAAAMDMARARIAGRRVHPRRDSGVVTLSTPGPHAC